MVRRSGYPGVSDPERRFEGMRAALAELRAMEMAQPQPSPGGQALDHAIMAVRMAANLLTRQIEFFGLHRHHDQVAYERTVAAFERLRPAVMDLSDMARSFHPGAPEARALDHAAMSLRMAADVMTGREDFYGIVRHSGAV